METEITRVEEPLNDEPRNLVGRSTSPESSNWIGGMGQGDENYFGNSW